MNATVVLGNAGTVPSTPEDGGRNGMPDGHPLSKKWKSLHSMALLTVSVIACLLPFVNKAFHIDDPLFLWAAQHIAKHPFDPYGFNVVWYRIEMPMSEVTKNPPLACYYAALAGYLGGWSERSLHVAFLLPAVAAILGTYLLARRWTRGALLAAAITLLTPGFMVSSSSVMCDTMMLALWIFAVLTWMKGLDEGKRIYLVVSGLLIAACALTKYFGMSLIPLLLAYSLFKQRRVGAWAAYLLIPVTILTGYEYWTQALYEHGLLSDASAYAKFWGPAQKISWTGKGLVGLAFAGGCMLPVLGFIPFLRSRMQILFGALLSGLAGASMTFGWVPAGAPGGQAHWYFLSAQLALCVAAGLSIVGLLFPDGQHRIDAGWMLLALWIIGTFLFAAFVNWTINSRSVLPMIPAVAILLCRGLDSARVISDRWRIGSIGFALTISAILSIWITWADTDLANSARTAARVVQRETQNNSSPVYFEGHWGFQYYMEAFGARPTNGLRPDFHTGDILVIPENNTNTFGPPVGFGLAGEVFELKLGHHITTMRQELGAGFYASVWGPLPFAIGDVPPERYYLSRLVPSPNQRPGAPAR